jgi:hypothetical protein
MLVGPEEKQAQVTRVDWPIVYFSYLGTDASGRRGVEKHRNMFANSSLRVFKTVSSEEELVVKGLRDQHLEERPEVPKVCLNSCTESEIIIPTPLHSAVIHGCSDLLCKFGSVSQKIALSNCTDIVCTVTSPKVILVANCHGCHINIVDGWKDNPMQLGLSCWKILTVQCSNVTISLPDPSDIEHGCFDYEIPTDEGDHIWETFLLNDAVAGACPHTARSDSLHELWD